MSMPPMSDLSEINDRMTQVVRQHRARFIVLGAALIVLGILSILFPLLSSIAVKIAIGWFLLLSGATMLYAAFQLIQWNWNALPAYR